MDVCDFGKRSARWAWDRLRDARKLDATLGEESLTDFFLLSCKKLANRQIKVRSFTRPEEYTTGADWEWWFTGPSGCWLGIRVQAKVISFPRLEYTHLHYKRKDGTYQCDQLIADAVKNGTIPAYCMYTNWEPTRFRPSWQCGTFRYSARHFGMSVLSPYQVQKFRKNGNTNDLNTVGHFLRPLHCLMCCSGYGGIDLPTRAWIFLENHQFVDIEQYQQWHMRDGTLLQSEPPYYVSQMLEGIEGDDFIDLHDKNLKRVTVYEQSE